MFTYHQVSAIRHLKLMDFVDPTRNTSTIRGIFIAAQTIETVIPSRSQTASKPGLVMLRGWNPQPEHPIMPIKRLNQNGLSNVTTVLRQHVDVICLKQLVLDTDETQTVMGVNAVNNDSDVL